MYSWEINEIMIKRNYVIRPEEYMQICNSSPQISWVHYDAYTQRHQIHTDDGYLWDCIVKKD